MWFVSAGSLLDRLDLVDFGRVFKTADAAFGSHVLPSHFLQLLEGVRISTEKVFSEHMIRSACQTLEEYQLILRKVGKISFFCKLDELDQKISELLSG